MSLSNAKATEVLELCLASETPQMRSKVYEIIEKSGLDSSDPMFLVLALTGQMRVFLEAAPVELQRLLIDWKKQNAESLAEIHHAAAQTKENYNDQIEAIKQSLKSVSTESVSDIKEAGMATASAIAEANSETLDRIQHLKGETEILKEDIQSLHSSVEADRQKNSESIIVVAGQFKQITQELQQANTQLKNSIFEAKKFQQRLSWARRAEWFTPLFALLIVGIGGGLLEDG